MKKCCYCSLLIGISILCSVTFGKSQSVEAPIHQLRIYEIFKNNKEAFHKRFRDHACRIMKNYGFKIVAIWESSKDDHFEFVYLLEWPSEKVMTESWAKFKADEEWMKIKKQMSEKYGELVGAIQDRTLILQDYSPEKHCCIDCAYKNR